MVLEALYDDGPVSGLDVHDGLLYRIGRVEIISFDLASGARVGELPAVGLYGLYGLDCISP